MIDETLVDEIAERVHIRWLAAKRAVGVVSRRSEAGEELMVPCVLLSEAAKRPRPELGPGRPGSARGRGLWTDRSRSVTAAGQKGGPQEGAPVRTRTQETSLRLLLSLQ